MSTLKDEFELMKLRIAAGHGEETVHVVWTDREKKKRLSPGPTTRFVLNCGTNELYRELIVEWERILTQIGNVSMARHIVGEWIRDALRESTAEKITEICGEGEQAGPPPATAEIPDWLRD